MAALEQRERGKRTALGPLVIGAGKSGFTHLKPSTDQQEEIQQHKVAPKRTAAFSIYCDDSSNSNDADQKSTDFGAQNFVSAIGRAPQYDDTNACSSWANEMPPELYSVLKSVPSCVANDKPFGTSVWDQNAERQPLAPLSQNHWNRTMDTSQDFSSPKPLDPDSSMSISMVSDQIRDSYESENDENVQCTSKSVYESAMYSSANLYCHAAEETEKEQLFDAVVSCPEYAEDIYAYLLEHEKKFRPKQNYMKKQKQLSEEMRTILVDWLIDVASEYHLEEQTLHLSVAYTDRFLSVMAVEKDHLQLVGITAMMIAAKYEEIYPPEVQEFANITDDTYTKQEMHKMEQIILKALGFNMTTPTAHIFLMSYLKACKADKRCRDLAKYLCDLALLEYSFLQYLPSHVAAAATLLANSTTGNVPWPVHLETMSKYTVMDFYPCVKHLSRIYQEADRRPQQAVREKYAFLNILQPLQVRPELHQISFGLVEILMSDAGKEFHRMRTT